MHYVMDNIADLLLNLHGWTVNIAFEVIVNNFDHKTLLQLGIKTLLSNIHWLVFVPVEDKAMDCVIIVQKNKKR